MNAVEGKALKDESLLRRLLQHSHFENKSAVKTLYLSRWPHWRVKLYDPPRLRGGQLSPVDSEAHTLLCTLHPELAAEVALFHTRNTYFPIAVCIKLEVLSETASDSAHPSLRVLLQTELAKRL